jgi:hypothetical protein
MTYLPALGATDASTTTAQKKFLQTQLNRYVKLTGLAPLGVDGVIGKGTATATKMALNEILKLSSPFLDGGAAAWKDYHQFAWSYMNTVDANAPATVAAQAYALADLFQKFGNFNGSPILKDAATPTTTPTTKPTTNYVSTKPATMPTVSMPTGGGGFAASLPGPLKKMGMPLLLLLGAAVIGVGYYLTKPKAK